MQHLRGTPLILVGQMWPGLIEWARESMLDAESPLASAPDMEIPQCVATADEAIALIRKHHSSWRKVSGKATVNRPRRE